MTNALFKLFVILFDLILQILKIKYYLVQYYKKKYCTKTKPIILSMHIICFLPEICLALKKTCIYAFLFYYCKIH